MTESIKNFPKYMVDNGLVFEINRSVLHPLGLAIVVDVDYNNKKKLSITALLKTEDEDGFFYDEDSFTVGKEKYDKFLSKNKNRLSTRKEKHGFVEQEEGIND